MRGHFRDVYQVSKQRVLLLNVIFSFLVQKNGEKMHEFPCFAVSNGRTGGGKKMRVCKSHEYFLTLVATEDSRLAFASARERAICMLMTRD